MLSDVMESQVFVGVEELSTNMTRKLIWLFDFRFLDTPSVGTFYVVDQIAFFGQFHSTNITGHIIFQVGGKVNFQIEVRFSSTSSNFSPGNLPTWRHIHTQSYVS